MKQLIICEKPSLASSVCKAINKMGERVSHQREKGYSESENYIVVPAFGHLFTLCDIEEYQEGYSSTEKYSWTMDNIPMIPKTFKFSLRKDFKTKKVDTGVKKQFETIKKLINANEVNSIIHCGDSDREGEIIIRIILDKANNNKPVYRLWLPDQVEDTIVASLNDLIDDAKFDQLAKEGYARMYIDWIYGINLTRYATLKSGSLLRVGRVISAIVKTIYDRDMEIKNFVPQKYYVAQSKDVTAGEEIELIAKQHFEPDKKAELSKICELYNSLGAKVTNIETKRKTIPSPKLYSQSTLQNALSKKFGFSPDKTLSIVQRLYEGGFVSYPRTGTEYMATAEKDKVKNIIEALNDNKIEFKDSKRIFDDSKIESHSAITPTVKAPGTNDFKSEDEKNCYETIKTRFCAVFYGEDSVVDETTMTISIGDEEVFEKKGTIIVTKGFKEIEPIKDKETVLPKLEIGDSVNISFKELEKTTTPKKHYTVETLNNFLKNPFKKDEVEEMDDEDYKAMLDGLEIGTEATRSGIIATAIKSNYFELKKSTYKILPAGERLVEIISKLKIDMSKEKTAELGKSLKDVYKGNKTTDEVIEIVKNEVETIFESNVEIEQVQRLDQEVVGKCPKCSKEVIENSKAYTCRDRECSFVIWKKISGKNITATQAKKLLNGRTDLIKGFKSKVGKSYSAFLVLKDDLSVGFEFEKR